MTNKYYSVHHVGSFVWSIHDARSEKHQVTLIVSLIANCCGQFEVLHYSLRTIKERAEEFVVKEMVSVDRSHNAKKKVSRHKKDVKFKKKKLVILQVSYVRHMNVM